MQDHHEDINVAASGLILNPELPWIGASPDGVVTCACHEPGILEIKCPFSAKDRSLLECTKDLGFCLTVPEGGVMSLKLDHSYLYQVNTLSLPERPGATLGQGPVASSCDAPRLLQLHKRQRYLTLREARHPFVSEAVKGNVSIHSHWITENCTPGSKYSPYGPSTQRRALKLAPVFGI